MWRCVGKTSPLWLDWRQQLRFRAVASRSLGLNSIRCRWRIWPVAMAWRWRAWRQHWLTLVERLLKQLHPAMYARYSNTSCWGKQTYEGCHVEGASACQSVYQCRHNSFWLLITLSSDGGRAGFIHGWTTRTCWTSRFCLCTPRREYRMTRNVVFIHVAHNKVTLLLECGRKNFMWCILLLWRRLFYKSASSR